MESHFPNYHQYIYSLFSKCQPIKLCVSSCFYYENQKPDPIDGYLEEFLSNLVELRKTGYKYNEKTFNVKFNFLPVMIQSELL